MGKNRQKYIPGIDGLRAIAVLAVILFHMDLLPFWQGGFTGVDVFFVISGYVISKSLAGRSGLKLGSYILGFYNRRLTRILPALLVMLLVTALASTLFIPSSWLSGSIDNTGLSAFFGYSNFNLALNNEHYFSPRVDFNPFLHTWSLGVEEQFYLLFPLIFFIQLKINGKGKTDKKGPRGEILYYGILIILAAASVIISAIESCGEAKNAYYLLPGRFWELAAGALLFQLHSRGILVPKQKISSNLLIIIGMVTVTAGFLLADRGSFPFPWALLPVAGSVLLISGALETDKGIPFTQKILSSPVLTYIGKISYSLYLWHWPVSVLFRWTFGFETVLAKGLYIALTFLMAVVSYHFIENPVRGNVFLKQQKSWKIVAASLSVVVVIFFTAWFIMASKSELSLSVTRNTYIWHSGRYWNDGPEKPVTEDPGILGRKLFALGDSHAAAYRTMLNIVSKELGIDVYEYEQGDGAVAGLLKPMNERAAAHYKNALQEISGLARPGDVVFLASLRMPEFGDQFEPVNIDAVVKEYFGEAAVLNRKAALEEAGTIVRELANTGVYVVMEAPLPVLFAPPYRCSDWFNRMNPIGANGLTVSRDFLIRIRRPVMESISALAGTYENFYVWDPFPVLCTDEIFSAYDQKGDPVFWDGDHLSGNGNRILVPSFREFLADLWGKPPGSIK